jgi:hypothetical protein
VVRDVSPEAPGPLHDALAVLTGLAILKILTMRVSEGIMITLFDVFGIDEIADHAALLTSPRYAVSRRRQISA